MTAALFALLGVVVGALMTGGVDYVMERRRERAEARQATRLVADELNRTRLVLDLILERDRLPPERLPGEEAEGLFPTTDWHAHKGALARGVGDDDWSRLATTYATIESMKLVILRTPDLPLEDEGRWAVTELRDQIAKLLTRLSGRPP